MPLGLPSFRDLTLSLDPSFKSSLLRIDIARSKTAIDEYRQLWSVDDILSEMFNLLVWGTYTIRDTAH
ncbi:hypothetical protein BBJ41_24985 [Burkholderia stabilis]|nr:hypothetical protein BBJ41_24985 [Burkholderia stabilis]